MTDETSLLRSLAVEAVATLMADAGEAREARRAAVLRVYPTIPASILATAEFRADAIAEERFLAPLREQFADRLAAIPDDARVRMLRDANRAHLDADIPF